MKKIILVVGYATLTLLTLLLFFYTLLVTISQRLYFLSLLQILIVTGLVYESGREWLTNLSQKKLYNTQFGRDDFWNFLAVVSGAVATYLISVSLGQGAVVAAGLVAVIVALIYPRYGVPVYCGAFVGMVCPSYITTYYQLLLAGVVAGIVFIISKPFFDGFGGKLGTIAFAGCLLTGFLMRSPLQATPVPGWDVGWLILIYAIVGAVCTYLLSITMGYGPVLASGMVGLTGGLLLPAIYPVSGDILAGVVICSSFAGMSSVDRFPRTYLMVIAGLFSGIVFMFSLPYLGGAGGKLGTIAFGSVIALKGVINILGLVKRNSLFSLCRKKEDNQ